MLVEARRRGLAMRDMLDLHDLRGTREEDPPVKTLALALLGFALLGFMSTSADARDGSVWGSGLNGDGQCTAPEPNSGFTRIAAGHEHSLGLRSDSTIVAWGDNNNGQATVPDPNTAFLAVAAGTYHSLGLSSLPAATSDKRVSPLDVLTTGIVCERGVTRELRRGQELTGGRGGPRPAAPGDPPCPRPGNLRYSMRFQFLIVMDWVST
jgi:hypothetical protein